MPRKPKLVNPEYKVIMLAPDPEEATKMLNELAAEGWRVVAMFEGNRIILVKNAA